MVYPIEEEPKGYVVVFLATREEKFNEIFSWTMRLIVEKENPGYEVNVFPIFVSDDLSFRALLNEIEEGLTSRPDYVFADFTDDTEIVSMYHRYNAFINGRWHSQNIAQEGSFTLKQVSRI